MLQVFIAYLTSKLCSYPNFVITETVTSDFLECSYFLKLTL